MLPIEETEQKWLIGFLDICEAVKGMKDVQWEDETVAAWWERTVETRIKNGEGVLEDDGNEEVVGKVERLNIESPR